MSQTNGAFVLKNKMGQVVRTFNWESNNLVVVLNKNTQRVETHESIDALKQQDIPFVLLAETSPKEIQKKPVSIANIGMIEHTVSLGSVSPSYDIPRETSEEFKGILRWAATAHVLVLVLLLLLNQFFPKTEELPPLVEVKIQPAEKLPEPVAVKEFKPLPKEVETPKKPVTVKVAKKKVVQPPKVVENKRRVVKPISENHRVVMNNTNPVKPKARLEDIGALGVLGSPNPNSKKAGGLDTSKITNTRAGGFAGTSNGAGHSGAFAGAGLVAASPGSGNKAERVAGYGTRGRAGGQEGYGNVSMAGTSSSFYTPVETDAEVEGGLDMDQVAEVFRRNIGQIRFCYEQGLQVKPDLKGRVGLSFVINPQGHVNIARVSKSSLRESGVENCLIGKLKSWQFPKPIGGVSVNVSYPIALNRVGNG
jgi:outer membrane biosynthesis protein TonB